MVTRRISSMVVLPSTTFCQPSSRRVRMPSLIAAWAMTDEASRLRISGRMVSLITSIS